MDEPPSTIVVFRRVPASVRRAAVRSFAGVLRDEVAGGRDFECLISNDTELRRLNREFRYKDYATDVLSFPSCGAGFSARKPAFSRLDPLKAGPRAGRPALHLG